MLLETSRLGLVLINVSLNEDKMQAGEAGEAGEVER